MLSDNNIKHENTFRLRTNLNDTQMKIGIPSCVKEHIDQEAKKKGRSMIAEILFRLVRSVNLEVKNNERVFTNE